MEFLFKKILFLALIPGFLTEIHAQPQLRRALFLGNSYTYVNDLPLLTAALAHSAGDSLFFDSNAPGGYTLGWQPIAHATNPVSLEKIRLQPWDFVVLQDQSQLPSIPVLRDSCMLPASAILKDSALANHACSRLLFFLTWGRRFGGTQCFTPNYCSVNFSDFGHMQDSLTRAYKLVADSLGGWIAPVGEAWRLVLDGSGMVLHDGDNSHPNLKGSYLAACVFYTSVFRKPSEGLTFTAGLQPDTALLLQRAADSVVFTWSPFWNLWENLPEAGFNLSLNGSNLVTTNTSANSTAWRWDFGDGSTSAAFEPVHTYQSSGNYSVTLTACDSCSCDSVSEQVSVNIATTSDLTDEKRARLTIPGPDGLARCIHCPENGILTLTDLTGRLIIQRKMEKNAVTIPELRRGWYLWSVKGYDNERIGGWVEIKQINIP